MATFCSRSLRKSSNDVPRGAGLSLARFSLARSQQSRPDLFAWSLATGLLVGFNALLFVPPFLVVVLAVYMQYRSLRRLNRFGIFIGGIAPPLRPRGSRLGDSGRLVIPFTSIARVEYLRYGEGPEYLAHFGAMVESSDGIRIAINDTMISGQVGRDPERLREAQRILERLAQRFGLQRQEGPATN